MDIQAKRGLVLVADRVLIDPDKKMDRTAAGLYLPPSVKEKEKVSGGYVVKTGPGYVIPDGATEEYGSMSGQASVKYVPLQASEGDYAIFLKDHAIEIEFDAKKYLIVPHAAILALVRTEIV